MSKWKFSLRMHGYDLLLRMAATGCFCVTPVRDARIGVSGELASLSPSSRYQDPMPTGKVTIACSFSPGTDPAEFSEMNQEKEYVNHEANVTDTCQVYNVKWSYITSVKRSVLNKTCESCKPKCDNVRFVGNPASGIFAFIMPSATCEDAGIYTCKTRANTQETVATALLEMIPKSMLLTTRPYAINHVFPLGTSLTITCQVYSTVTVTWDWWYKNFPWTADNWKKLEGHEDSEVELIERCRHPWTSIFVREVTEWDYGRSIMCRAIVKRPSQAKSTKLLEQYRVLHPGTEERWRLTKALTYCLSSMLVLLTFCQFISWVMVTTGIYVVRERTRGPAARGSRAPYDSYNTNRRRGHVHHFPSIDQISPPDTPARDHSRLSDAPPRSVGNPSDTYQSRGRTSPQVPTTVRSVAVVSGINESSVDHASELSVVDVAGAGNSFDHWRSMGALSEASGALRSTSNVGTDACHGP